MLSSVLHCCVPPVGGAVEPPSPLSKSRKELVKKKKANLSSIVRSSRHGKSYFVAARTGISPKESGAPCWCWSTEEETAWMLTVLFLFALKDRWRCAGTCLQAKRSKFQCEGMRSGLRLQTGITITHPSVFLRAGPLCLGNIFIKDHFYCPWRRIKCSIREQREAELRFLRIKTTVCAFWRRSLVKPVLLSEPVVFVMWTEVETLLWKSWCVTEHL